MSTEASIRFSVEELAELCKYSNEELVLTCTSTVDVYEIEIIPVRESSDGARFPAGAAFSAPCAVDIRVLYVFEKRSGHEADQTPPPIPKLKNTPRFTSTPLCICMSWCLSAVKNLAILSGDNNPLCKRPSPAFPSLRMLAVRIGTGYE